MDIFETGFGSYTYSGDTIEATREGFKFVATVHHDSDHGAPWDECEGHGPVSDWTRRDKQPGELVLCESRGSKRFYDFAEACRIARRDSWGFAPYRVDLERGANGLVRFTAQEFPNGSQGECVSIVTDWHDCQHAARAQMYQLHNATMSPREYASRAARHDFEVLRAWCNSDWTYCGIAVQVFDSDNEELTCEYDFALWGIEMNYPNSDNEYLRDVANELANEAFDSAILPLLQSRATVDALQSVGI